MHKEINIDFVVNRQRRCGCPCSACKERGVHSVENCEIECSDIVNELRSEDMHLNLEETCTCDCPFCSSGVINTMH